MSYSFNGDCLCLTKRTLHFWDPVNCEARAVVPSGTLVHLGPWLRGDGRYEFRAGQVAQVCNGKFVGYVRTASRRDLRPISPLEYLAIAVDE